MQRMRTRGQHMLDKSHIKSWNRHRPKEGNA